MKKIRKYRNVLLFLIDILIIFASYFLTSFLMLDEIAFIEPKNLELINNSIIISLFVYQIVFSIFEFYKNITRYENGKDYIKYILACGLSACLVIALKFIFKLQLVNIKQILFSGLIIAIGTVTYRVIIRFILTTGTDSTHNIPEENRKNLLIIGAGEAARDIIKTLKTTMRNTYNIIGLIDDNEGKYHYLISGGKVQIRKTKKRRSYYICENNPATCDYISWNKPGTEEKENNKAKPTRRKTSAKKTTRKRKNKSNK